MVKRAFGLTATALLTAWAISDSQYFTAWYGIYWGIITSIAMLSLSTGSGWWDPHLRLALPAQLTIVLMLIVGASIATSWTHLSARDSIQWTWTLVTATVYWDGLKWGMERIRHA